MDNTKVDDGFFDRADELIHLANNQMLKVNMGKVSASMLYSVARFNAYVSANGCNTMEELKKARQETIDYFVSEYEIMLKENLDDYIKNFDKYKNLKG